ncbi:Interferon- developmental regulator 1 [Homalodisca vitripennis]|nr:Interferon- developmental regulator 1 [Homalodisca vitripennis]
MSGLLDSPHLDVRMAAGEVIALMMERGRQYDDDYEWEAGEQLIDKLRQLATDSHKYRAKKDRKTQRSSFRDILRYVEDDCPPNIQVRFGLETLALDSWCRKKQYDAFCQTRLTAPPASREECITRYVTDRSADCRAYFLPRFSINEFELWYSVVARLSQESQPPCCLSTSLTL